jgi:hypothetical protein
LLRELSDDEEDAATDTGLDVPDDPQRPWLHDYHCHRMGHRLSYRALTAALWLEGEENGRGEGEAASIVSLEQETQLRVLESTEESLYTVQSNDIITDVIMTSQ